MANVLGELFGNIANAIRSKTGDTATMKPAEFPDKIAAIETGGGSSEDVRYVTFMSEDGAVEYGKKAVAVGDDCADPIARGVFDTPTKESTDQYDYTHYAWATEPNGATNADALKNVTEDRTVYATFIATVRTYTISYYDGDSLMNSVSMAYGSTPSYTPTKDGYDFVSWSPALTTVTGDASYYAQWAEKPSFGIMTWPEISEVIAAGTKAEYFSLGDARTEVMTNEDGSTESVEFEIVDTDPSNIISGTNLAVMAKYVLNDPIQYDSDGHGSNMYYLYSDILSHLNTLVSCFSEDMQAVMQSVSMPYANGSSKLHIPTSNMVLGYEYNYATSNNTPTKSNMLEAFANGKSAICYLPDGETIAPYWTANTEKVTAASGLYPTYITQAGKLSYANGTEQQWIRLLFFI